MKRAAVGGVLLLGLMLVPGLTGAQIAFPVPNLIWERFKVIAPVGAQMSAIVVDSAGRAHIAFRDTLNGTLKYARRNSNGTTSAFVVDSGGSVGFGLSLVLDASNNPHISYYRSTNAGDPGDAKHAKGNCFAVGQSLFCTFTKTVIESGVQDSADRNNTSVAIDGDGVPHVAYVDNTNGRIKWARNLSGAWDIVSVVNTSSGNVSMAVDSNNFPHIVFIDDAEQLRYVRVVCQFILCGWGFETVTTGAITPTMRRTADGKVHVAFTDGSAVRYALRTCSGSTCGWSLQVVGATNFGLFPGLALDSAGGPHITFVRSPVGAPEVAYARRQFPGWKVEVADIDIGLGTTTSIALDANNVRHVSATGGSDQSLRHLKGKEPPPPVLFP
jgi:hypothetical protein